MAKIIYKCKNCQANLVFDPISQKLKCEYCDSKFEMSEFETEQLAKESKDDVIKESQTAEDIENPEDMEMVTYTCSTCKGEIITEATTTATFCPYCGNSTILAGNMEGDFKPRLVLPFEKTVKDAKEIFVKECKKRILCPKEFISVDNVEKVKGIYVPYYLYDCKVEGEMEFSCTKVHTTRTSKQVITKTSFYDVDRGGTVYFEKVPADASSKMDDAVMSALEPFDFGKFKDFSTAYMTGFYAEKNDVTEADGFEPVAKRVKGEGMEFLRDDISGFNSKIVKREALHTKKDRAELALLPVYMVNTRYKDKQYLFAMNGQTGEFLGEFPVSKGIAMNYFWKITGVAYAISILIYLFGGF
ncbi:MAG: hypothetical protein R3Y47_02460 [Lachnospiraceae bacterium]